MGQDVRERGPKRVADGVPVHTALMHALTVEGDLEWRWEINVACRYFEQHPSWTVLQVQHRLGFADMFLRDKCREYGYPQPGKLRRMVRVLRILDACREVTLEEAGLRVDMDPPAASTAVHRLTGKRPSAFAGLALDELAHEVVRLSGDSS